VKQYDLPINLIYVDLYNKLIDLGIQRNLYRSIRDCFDCDIIDIVEQTFAEEYTCTW